jgi:FtsZ-binding cell division protein ZapB
MTGGPQSKAAAMLRQRKNDSTTKRRSVLATIEAMERADVPITVAEVARRARVSPWLVRQEPLMTMLKEAQTNASHKSITAEATKPSLASLQVERDLLREANQRLRREADRYRQRISELLGSQIDGTDAHSQNLRVSELTDQNRILTRQTTEVTQENHELGQKVEDLATDLEAAHTVNRALMAQLNRATKASQSGIS